MDSVSRLVVALLLMVSAGMAYATTCTMYKAGVNSFGTNEQGVSGTPAGACATTASLAAGISTLGNPVNSRTYKAYTVMSSSTTTCMLKNMGYTCAVDGAGAEYSCGTPPGTTFNAGMTTFGQECDTVCGAKSGKTVGAAGTEYGYNGGSAALPVVKNAICDAASNCSALGSNPITVSERGPDGVWTNRVAGSDFSFTGTACQPGQTPDAAPPPCKLGEVKGSINGTDVCVKSTTISSTDVKTTEVPTVAGKTTVTSTTTCGDGLCATTTITTISGATSGNGSSATISTQAQGTFCAANPTNKSCSGPTGTGKGGGSGTGEGEGDESSFGGSCAATTCSGDAIQCAIAAEQAKRSCELALVLGDGSRTHTLAVAGDAALTAGDTPTAHPRNAAVATTDNSLANGFDQSRLIGGACPSDRMIGSGAHAFMLPLSKVCGPAVWLGNLLVGLTALSCLGILFVRT